MKDFQLGEFEEIVLLTVAILHGDAYGVSVKKEIEERLKRSVSVGALQSALRRMEEKDYLRSEFGETTARRGGKRKRYFEITDLGKQALAYTKETRNQLWDAIPDVVLKFAWQ
ncbi:PadR family transcriptional regulator [Marinoscillum sp.]|uniref:PadR family transcriptional regulator n=1 Tax=Marinoscillum sp. TaxID=2024838 RepID=UPI003BAC9A85